MPRIAAGVLKGSEAAACAMAVGQVGAGVRLGRRATGTLAARGRAAS